MSMEIIREELNRVTQYILENFEDPFPENKLKNFIAGKSKMIRSVITILWLKANEKELPEDIYKILAAGEIIHNASLLHDDVIDNAETRRNELTFAKTFSPKIAILAGDFLVSYSIEKLNSLNNPVIIDNFKNCIKSMAQAEIKQYFLRNTKPDIDTYIEICMGKTANLFGTILESCALIANLSKEKARTFGEAFGILFQIKNDLNENSAKNDKVNGIMTAGDIIGIENTLILSDNYKGKSEELLISVQDNKYKRALKELIKDL